MPIKLFSVPALDPGTGEHDVNQFCAQHRVVSIERRLVTVHDRPVWCFCVEYLLQANPAAAAGGGDYRPRVDYKQSVGCGARVGGQRSHRRGSRVGFAGEVSPPAVAQTGCASKAIRTCSGRWLTGRFAA